MTPAAPDAEPSSAGTLQDWSGRLDALTQAVWVVDPSGRVQYLNRAALALAPSGRRVLGQPVVTVGPQALGATASEVVAEAIGLGGSVSRAARCVESGRAWDLVAVPRTGPAEVVLSAWDVTEHVELALAARTGETLSAIGVVVAGLAHAVRNPVFALSAMLEAMELEAGAQGRVAEYTGQLRAEVDRLSGIAGALFDYGRPPPARRGPVDLGQLAGEARAACEDLASAVGVQIELHVQPRLPLVIGDRHRLLEVLVHLLKNAIQASPREGKVTAELAAGASLLGPSVLVRVLDRGHGLRAEDVGRVLEPFFSRRRHGLGLGLAIVERTMFEHGGSVTLANRSGGGAVVSLALPVRGGG